ncbi:MAG: hypothetical protein IJT51_00095 [Bacteroidales bacterium]|nr:hypothetical protein [Bacteroidales bacterium]
MKTTYDIGDDEIRIINRKHKPKKPLYSRWWFWLALFFAMAALAAAIVAAIFVPLSKHNVEGNNADSETLVSEETVEPFLSDTASAKVLVGDTVVNDVMLTLFTPVNAKIELCVGMPDTTLPELLLALQAADIRADNREIVGAFVLKGELLSRGVAKKGFCAIIDGKIHLGMAESTSLFEESIDKDGYFFRQYPLVCNGSLVENKPKGKSLRCALCELDGHIVVVRSLTRESFHDFSQALVDIGVENAIYLVGGDAYGFCRTGDSVLSWSNAAFARQYKNTNFIVWKSLFR